MIITLNFKPNFFKGLLSFSKVKINHKLESKIARAYDKNPNSTIMTENAVHLAIQYVLPRNSAWPKGSALFYEKLNPDVFLLVSGFNISQSQNLLTRSRSKNWTLEVQNFPKLKFFDWD